jgi:hypothetical protein
MMRILNHKVFKTLQVGEPIICNLLQVFKVVYIYKRRNINYHSRTIPRKSFLFPEALANAG